MGLREAASLEFEGTLKQMLATLKGCFFRNVIALLVYFVLHVIVAVASFSLYSNFASSNIFMISSAPIEFFLALPICILYLIFCVCFRSKKENEHTMKKVSAIVDLLAGAQLTRLVLFSIGAYLDLTKLADCPQFSAEKRVQSFVEAIVDHSAISAAWILCFLHSAAILYFQSAVKKVKLIMEAGRYVGSSLRNVDAIVEQARRGNNGTIFVTQWSSRQTLQDRCMATLEVPVIEKMRRAENYMCMGGEVKTLGSLYRVILPITCIIINLILNGLTGEFEMSKMTPSDWVYVLQLVVLMVVLPLSFHDYRSAYFGTVTKLGLIVLISLIVHQLYFFVVVTDKWTRYTLLFLQVRKRFDSHPSSVTMSKMMNTIGFPPSSSKEICGGATAIGMMMNLNGMEMVMTIHCLYTYLCLAIKSKNARNATIRISSNM